MFDPVHTRVMFTIDHAGFSKAIGTVSGSEGSLYFDVRNLLGRQNLVSVRPETGTPYASPATVDSAVQAAYAAFADVRIVIFRPLGGVEMRSVVRSDFDPRCGIDGRRPHDGETVVGDLLQVGPVGNAYRGLSDGNAPGR